MTRSYLTTALVFPLLLQAGCDAKAGDGYEGESLLTIHGSVQLASTDVQGELKPALAFNSGVGELTLQEVQYSGSFPADVTLDVMQPPPDSALLTADRFFMEGPRSVRLAIANITAVRPDHPAVLRSGDGAGFRYECEGGVTDTPNVGAEQDPENPSSALLWDWEDEIRQQRRSHRGQPGAECKEWVWTEAEDGSSKYERISRCDYEFKSCEVLSSEGDPELLRSVWERLDGLSTNYVVLYLPQPIAAGTPTARAFGGSALAQGYHLLKVSEYSESEAQPYADCVLSQKAVELYNRAHGTTFGGIEELFAAVSPPPVSSADTAAYEATNKALQAELGALWVAAVTEKCADLQPALGRPIQTASANISIQLSRDLTPSTSFAPSSGGPGGGWIVTTVDIPKAAL